MTGKFASCAPEISKIYYKIYRGHQNCTTEISVAQCKLSRLVCSVRSSVVFVFILSLYIYILHTHCTHVLFNIM